MRRQSWWHVVSANSMAEGPARLVLIVLSMHATRNGYVGLPVKLLARLAKCSVKTVRTVLFQLIGMNEIRRIRKGGGKGKHAIYRIIVTAVEEVDTKRYKVRIVEVEAPEEFPPLRVMEEPKEL